MLKLSARGQNKEHGAHLHYSVILLALASFFGVDATTKWYIIRDHCCDWHSDYYMHPPPPPPLSGHK